MKVHWTFSERPLNVHWTLSLNVQWTGFSRCKMEFLNVHWTFRDNVQPTFSERSRLSGKNLLLSINFSSAMLVAQNKKSGTCELRDFHLSAYADFILFRMSLLIHYTLHKIWGPVSHQKVCCLDFSSYRGDIAKNLGGSRQKVCWSDWTKAKTK